MKPLRGLGVWIWELSKCEGGSISAIVAKARATGVSWVAVKCGENTSNGQVSKSIVDELRAGGVECAVWWYCRPTSIATQVAMLVSMKALGVEHFIMDAEVEWDAPGLYATAAALASSLRSALGDDVWLYDAPWARPVAHKAPFPYAAFGAVMTARMPQLYWELAEVAGESQAHFLATADLQWAQTAPGATICPALSTVNYDGTKHAPISELATALDRYAEREAVSIWSWQHLTTAEWALLEQRSTVDVTNGGQDNPVFVTDPQVPSA